jgi:hypothetical protein
VQVVPGELTIVTGLSNSGKSEWLDALTVNLAEQYGWRFAMCSLENTVTEHGRKLMEKYTRKAQPIRGDGVGTRHVRHCDSQSPTSNTWLIRGGAGWQMLV